MVAYCDTFNSIFLFEDYFILIDNNLNSTFDDTDIFLEGVVTFYDRCKDRKGFLERRELIL